MNIIQLAMKSSDVRQYWASFMDDVFHRVPKLVQRNERDVFMALNFDYLSALLDNVRYSVEIEQDKETGEFIATMDDFWFVESGRSEKEAIHKLANQLLDFSHDYFNEIQTHQNEPNFKSQFQKVTRALVTNDAVELEEFFDVEHI